MELNDKVTQLEDEIKILKNEIQAVLLDLREGYLNNKNPFNAAPATAIPAADLAPATPPPPSISEPEKELAVQTTESISVAEAANDEIDSSTEPQDIDLSEISEEPAILNGTEKNRKDATSLKEPETGEKAPKLIKEWRTKAGENAGFQSSRENNQQSIEISTMAKLVQWVEDSSARLGQARTKTMLDVAGMMGYVTEDLKNILDKLISKGSGVEIKPDSKDYLASWLELAAILGKDNKPEIALFYILCQEAENR